MAMATCQRWAEGSASAEANLEKCQNLGTSTGPLARSSRWNLVATPSRKWQRTIVWTNYSSLHKWVDWDLRFTSCLRWRGAVTFVACECVTSTWGHLRDRLRIIFIFVVSTIDWFFYHFWVLLIFGKATLFGFAMLCDVPEPGEWWDGLLCAITQGGSDLKP